jgi:metallophosphoesterase (TIGR00282 family)
MPAFLFLGDIVGRPGRQAVLAQAKALRESLAVDWLIANGENAAGGAGLTAAIANELTQAGVDALTLGDHVWDQRNFDNEIDALEKVCRPANLAPECPGRRWLLLSGQQGKLAVFTLMGRTFMKGPVHCPYACADALLTEIGDQADAILVEIHAEATSEKLALGRYLDGKVTAVLGTHTHVATADATLLPAGTAYQTDVGMCGPYDSIIGREVAPVIQAQRDGMKRKLPVAQNDVRLVGSIIHFDPANGKATQIQPFSQAHGLSDQ